MLEARQEFWLWSKEKIIKNDSITWGEKKNIKNGLLKSILPPFVIPTVQNLSFCQVPEKSELCKKMLSFKKKKKTAENISKFQKWQLGLEVGGLQLKMPYHVLKLSSVGGKKPKRCFCKVSHSVLSKKKRKKKCTVQNRAESIKWRQSY